MRDRLRKWWVAPLVIPRWTLTIEYTLFAVFGILAAVAGLPTIDLTTPEGYAPIWSGLVAVSALVAGAGSVRTPWEPVERWAVVALTSLLSVYAAAAGYLAFVRLDVDRWAGFVVVLIVTLLPGIRMVQLLLRTGLHRG